jgi:hypothetical protein
MKTLLAFAALVVLAVAVFMNTSAFAPKSADAVTETRAASSVTVINEGSFTVDLPESSVLVLSPMTVTGSAPHAVKRAAAKVSPASHECTRYSAGVAHHVGTLLQESGSPVLSLDCR